MKKVDFISVYVIKNTLGDFTCDGITSKETNLFLFSDKNNIEDVKKYIDENNMDINKCLIVDKSYTSMTTDEMLKYVSKLKDIKDVINFVKDDVKREYVRCTPITLMASKKYFMAGGNYVYTSDSRYKTITGVSYPISVHDRVENW